MKAHVPISSHARRIALAALLALLPLTACDDSFNQSQPLPLEPTTVSLADYRTGQLGEATAFQLGDSRTVLPSQTSDWDFVFWVTDASAPQFRPRDMIASGDSDAGLAPVDVDFDALEEAPESGYRTNEPVSAEVGAVYAVRSRQDPRLGLTCRRYAKIRVASVDTAAGTVTFDHLVNPNCQSRNLLPGEQGQQDD